MSGKRHNLGTSKIKILPGQRESESKYPVTQKVGTTEGRSEAVVSKEPKIIKTRQKCKQ